MRSLRNSRGWNIAALLAIVVFSIFLMPLAASAAPPVDLHASPDAIFVAHFGVESSVISAAAERNGLDSKLLPVLFAIRKTENGAKGTEFGILHCRAVNTDLNTQAGWAAATVKNGWNRYIRDGGDPSDIGAFIAHLGNRYCPASADPLGHERWVRNMGHWYERLS
jgi:hypothetical protein